MKPVLYLVVALFAITTNVFPQQEGDGNNYVEVRTSRQYQFGEYARTVQDKAILDIYFIRTTAEVQGFAGVGRVFKLGDTGTVNALLYGVAGSHDQLGVMPALLIPHLQKGRLKTTAFLGWFIPAKGEMHQYLVLDSWDTTVKVNNKLDIGCSVGFFLQNGKWHQQAGPMARFNLDGLGGWTISQRFGPGGKELRLSRTFTF